MKKRAPQDQELLKILKEMSSLQAQYPEELRSSRRAAFLDQVASSSLEEAREQPDVQDRRVVGRLQKLGSVPVEYPPRLLAARRSAFVRQIAWLNFVSLYTAMWLAVKERMLMPVFAARSRLASPLLAAGLALAVLAGYLVYERQTPMASPVASTSGTVKSGRILTSDAREVRIICKPGAQPPLCLAGEYKRDVKLTYQGNGLARPAVAKDSMSVSGSVHKPANINDGLYGPGASWISNSRNSWIKIDLGKATKINTVTFGRDRLGELNGHNPGQFVVALATSDDVYADGDNSNDTREYELVFNSAQAGFSGKIEGAETVTAQFTPQVARFIKITFENKGTAIDEVEAFMATPPVASSAPGNNSSIDKSDRDSSSTVIATLTSLPPSTNTSQPVDTATAQPSNTPMPSDTATPIPTATEVPSNTPVPTSTLVPTSSPVPTNSPTPMPSNTPLPPPTKTPLPPATSTPVPAATDTPAPTDLPPLGDLSPRIDIFDLVTSLPH